MTAAVQCIPASAGTSYELYAESHAADAADAGMDATATALGASFFAAQDCTGPPITTFLGPISLTRSVWSRRHASAPAPAGTQSLLVRLLVQKPLTQASASALFDNVLVSHP
jgi:hypothetical protein